MRRRHAEEARWRATSTTGITAIRRRRHRIPTGLLLWLLKHVGDVMEPWRMVPRHVRVEAGRRQASRKFAWRGWPLILLLRRHLHRHLHMRWHVRVRVVTYTATDVRLTWWRLLRLSWLLLLLLLKLLLLLSLIVSPHLLLLLLLEENLLLVEEARGRYSVVLATLACSSLRELLNLLLYSFLREVSHKLFFKKAGRLMRHSWLWRMCFD